MYHFIRRIHLFTGLILLIFVMMYFTTGYVMVHESWFPRGDPVVTQRTELLSTSTNLSNDAMAVLLQERFDIRGQRMPPTRKKDGSWRFNYSRPGTVYEAVVSADGGKVTVTEKKLRFERTMNGLHRQKGYGGGRIYSLWSLLYDLASAALVVFAVSGVFLWWKSTSGHLPGCICLALGCGFTFSMVLCMMLHR